MDKKNIAENRFRKTFLNLNRINYHHSIKTYSDVPYHWHNYYEIELLLGKGETKINDRKFTFEDGVLVLLSPASMHSYTFKNSQTESFNIQFNIEHLESNRIISLLSKSESFLIPLNKTKIEWYVNIYKILERNFNKVPENYKIYANKTLEFLLVNIFMDGLSVETNLLNTVTKSSDQIHKAILYMHKHYREDIRVKDVADQLTLSENYFSALFKKEYGCSFTQYLTKIRLANARNMLCTFNDSVSIIAKESGFRSPKHFHKLFKETYGITPQAFRKEYFMVD